MLRTCTTHIKPILQQIRLLPGFKHGWKNAQHRYSTRFVAMLQKKLHVQFVARFSVPLLGGNDSERLRL